MLSCALRHLEKVVTPLETMVYGHNQMVSNQASSELHNTTTSCGSISIGPAPAGWWP